jgi:hypothetical protein
MFFYGSDLGDDAVSCQSMVQCINLAIKNAMMDSIAVGRSPRMFHFKPYLQNAITFLFSSEVSVRFGSDLTCVFCVCCPL